MNTKKELPWGLWASTAATTLASRLEPFRLLPLLEDGKVVLCLKPPLGGSWVVTSRVISRITILIAHIQGLITLLITTPEPPSTPALTRLRRGVQPGLALVPVLPGTACCHVLDTQVCKQARASLFTPVGRGR